MRRQSPNAIQMKQRALRLVTESLLAARPTMRDTAAVRDAATMIARGKKAAPSGSTGGQMREPPQRPTIVPVTEEIRKRNHNPPERIVPNAEKTAIRINSDHPGKSRLGHIESGNQDSAEPAATKKNKTQFLRIEGVPGESVAHVFVTAAARTSVRTAVEVSSFFGFEPVVADSEITPVLLFGSYFSVDGDSTVT